MDDTVKDEYASLNTNYTTADEKMFFLPRDISGKTFNTGFISAELSNENGQFEDMDRLLYTLIMGAPWTFKSLIDWKGQF